MSEDYSGTKKFYLTKIEMVPTDSTGNAQSVNSHHTVAAEGSNISTDVDVQMQSKGVTKDGAEVYDYSKSFAQQIDDWQNGVFPAYDTFVVGATPSVFNQIGLSALPITYTQKHLRENLSGDVDHLIDENSLKTLPTALENPIAIFASKSNKGRIVAIVDLKSTSGNSVIAAIEISGYGTMNGQRIDSNAITSIHSRSNTITGLLNDAIIENDNGNATVFYVQKNKALNLLKASKVQFLGGKSLIDGFNHSISENSDFVNTNFLNQTETQQFKRWFGKSKVVNADGTPKVVYHGTDKRFTVFKSSDSTYRFSESYDYAESMAEERSGNTVIPVYLSMKNPYHAKLPEGKFSDPVAEKPIIDKAKAGNYDGVIIECDTNNEIVNDKFYVVFDSAQIKSAANNIGTFDGSNADIRFQKKQAKVDKAGDSGYNKSNVIPSLEIGELSLKEMRSIFKQGNTNPDLDLLFDKVYDFCQKASTTVMVMPSVVNREGRPVPGKAKGNVITLSQMDFNDARIPSDKKVQAILHEMLHVATAYAMDAYDTTVKRGAAAQMRKDLFECCDQIAKVYDSIKNNALFKDEYGIKNPKEMIAELSNPKFTEKLKVTYASIWDRLLDDICKLFGINKDFSNYAKLKKAVEDIITNPELALRDRYYQLADRSYADVYYLDESEYQDKGKGPIKFQRKNTAEPEVSNREILANALESVTQHEVETKRLQEYKEHIELLNSEEKKLRELNAEIKELSFAVGHRDTARIKALKVEATKTENRINIHDKKLLSLEATEALKNVLEREKARVRKAGKEKLGDVLVSENHDGVLTGSVTDS